ncbi:hypothetical protein D3C78_1761500 [compost metagenome]
MKMFGHHAPSKVKQVPSNFLGALALRKDIDFGELSYSDNRIIRTIEFVKSTQLLCITVNIF